jgi:hypothetical protein
MSARIPMPNYRLTVPDALARLPGPNGERYVELFKHGTLSVELYARRADTIPSRRTRGTRSMSSSRATANSEMGASDTPSQRGMSCSYRQE